jgi:hypothetical protein
MELNKIKSFWKYIFLFLIICDLAYTFAENYYNTSIDGDLPAIVLPGSTYAKVLDDPFGLNVLLKNEKYPATNRFFIHWSMVNYFHQVPLILQKFTDPIKSVYLSMALFRTLLQVLLLLILALMIGGSGKDKVTWSIVAALLITPFFQTEGYSTFMGLIYCSITYSFFYSLPLLFFLAYVYPFYRNYFLKDNQSFSALQNIFLFLLAFPIALGGPLTGPMIIILSLLSLLAMTIKFAKTNKVSIVQSILSLPKPVLFHFSFIVLLSVYSFYIGLSNSENDWAKMALIDRFKLMPKGLRHLFFGKAGLPILLACTMFFTRLIRKMNTDEGKRIVSFVNWIALACILYLILLPFGGYRPYRPFIVRFDTFAPVTLVMIYCYGVTALFLIQRIKASQLKWLGIFLLLVGLIFTNADRIKKDGNACERQALKTLVSSPEEVVYLETECSLMSWSQFTNPDDSRVPCKVLRMWNILEKDKLFYQQK